MDQKSNNMKKRPVESSSDDWKITEFKMQLSLGTSSAIAKEIYDISNTNVCSNFNSYARGSIVLESMIQIDNLTQQNQVSKIVQKGFELSPEGMLFNVGYNRKMNLKSKKKFTFLLSKISVGKSYCYPLRDYQRQKILCPDGFDSIYLYEQQQNPQVFTHQYVIFKNYQVYPCFLIDIEVDTNQQMKSKHPLCQNCVKIPPDQARFYCLTQEAHFCYDCDAEYHSTKLASKHKRVQISQKPKRFGFCEFHDGINLELYCKTCAQALCVNCKIIGDHSTGIMAEHGLTKLKDAYNDISSKVKQIDPNIQRRKNQLTQDLSKIDMKIKEVNSNATKIEEQLYSRFQKALRQLQSQTQRKLSFLIGDQLELKRQYDHILWMQSFLKYQLQVQQPNQFLKSWYKYSKYKKQILSLSNLSINTEVKADMRLEGDIHVIVESAMTKRVQNVNASIPINSSQGANFSRELDSIELRSPEKMQRQLGSTMLRKTIFKKHYNQKMQEIGSQPPFLKGSIQKMGKGSVQNV